MIHPNTNPESVAVIGAAWPEHSEDSFRADATSQRDMAGAADAGATAVGAAQAQTAETLTGAAGSALQDRLGEDTATLSMSGTRHADAASLLDAVAVNIEEAKTAMNAVDAEYHTQVAALTAQAAAEGWTPQETAVARADLLAQAQQSVGAIRAGFDGAYEGIVSSLTELSGGSAPKIQEGTVEYPPPGAPAQDGATAGEVSTAHTMGQATGSAAVDFTAGMLAGIAGQGAGSGVYAPGYDPMGTLGGMGAGYGVLAPGYDMNGMGGYGYGMNGYGAGGYGMNGYGAGGYGMNGYGAGGYGMNGYGAGGMGMGAQQSPVNQIGRAVGSLAQALLGGAQSAIGGAQSAIGSAQAGLAGQTNLPGAAGQTDLAGMVGGQTGVAPGGLAELLQQNGLSGEAAGLVDSSTDLATGLSSATSSEDLDQVLADAIDAVAADPDGDSVPGDTGDAGGDTGDTASDASDAGGDTGDTGGDAEDTTGDTADAADDATADVADAGDDAADTAPDSPDDGSIPARPADATPAMDPVTQLQTDVNNAIGGAAAAAHSGVDTAADAARAALNTDIGVVTTGNDGSVHADTIGLQGPQHIDAIRTETASADLSARDAAPAPAAAPTAAPTAGGYGAGTPMMTPTPGVLGTPATPVAAANASGAAANPALPDTRALHQRGDSTPPSAPPPASAGSSAASTSFLALLDAPVAGAHTRLALLRVQQFTHNAVNPSAIGVFTTDTATTYVIATAHGLAYLPHDGALSSDTRLLSELADDHFYRQWCGHANPVAKLTDFANRDHTLGHLNCVLTSVTGVRIPGVEVITQSLTDVTALVESDLLAPFSRTRRDLARAQDTALGAAVRDMAMHTEVLSAEQYLHVFGRASAALWSNDDDRDIYRGHWLQVLTADALRAADRGAVADAWFAVDEYRRVERCLG